eukprot:TRINITY_DN1039_c0_g1_i1.p1 TRINITY_DN1039_c0_g1~~TRINITY_DN1039_c0_g1_i1.p1  ORF type:complete len:382 (-),score=88.22 TRINITY_DN1039_c0_g1_i1:201-1346(-)
MQLSLSVFVALICLSTATVFYEETFGSLGGWTHSSDSGKGKFELSSGKYKGDQGLQTSQDAKFYAISDKFDKSFSNEGKDLVVSFSVTHEQDIDCGGGYIKVMPDFKEPDFNGDTTYNIMFGPDICGATKKIHLIFNYKGQNLLWKKEPRCESDTLTHFYTLLLKPDNTYEVYVDKVKKESGKLEEDWEFLKPKTIPDPEDKKPSDWVDDAEMVDPEDKKPSDWDDEPEKIVDPDASKPEDWDDEEDGEWEAPMISNPKYKGEWKPKMIPNPAYKGVWKAREIPNPDYVADDKLYLFTDNSGVGFDLWQVKSGTIFDNIVVSDSLDDAWAAYDAAQSAVEAEKKAKDAADEEKRKQEEADRKAKADEEEEEEEEEEENDEL